MKPSIRSRNRQIGHVPHLRAFWSTMLRSSHTDNVQWFGCHGHTSIDKSGRSSSKKHALQVAVPVPVGTQRRWRHCGLRMSAPGHDLPRDRGQIGFGARSEVARVRNWPLAVSSPRRRPSTVTRFSCRYFMSAVRTGRAKGQSWAACGASRHPCTGRCAASAPRPLSCSRWPIGWPDTVTPSVQGGGS